MTSDVGGRLAVRAFLPASTKVGQAPPLHRPGRTAHGTGAHLTPRLSLGNGRNVDSRAAFGGARRDEGFGLLGVAHQGEDGLSGRGLDDGREILG